MKKQSTNHTGNKSDSHSINSFKVIFDKAAYGNSYDKVFDDFLNICIATLTRNPATGLSYYEDEYMSVIEPYKANGTLKYFPQLFAELILFMEENKDNSQGNDLLGTFFEQELSRGANGQFFTPFHVCLMMAQITKDREVKPVNVLDSCCGSGRMLLALAKDSKFTHGYFGMDIDARCVKITALNLFLNGLRGEVMCGDALAVDDFKVGYKVSFSPLGIFKIENKEDSSIWHSQQLTYSSMKPTQQEKPPSPQLQLF
ncbi:MAG: N-6 DNA methylase [Bacteroidia bacterium]